MATIYASTDPGAPAMGTAPGGLITVLDAILVNGYGSKPAAGWTKEYTGTNVAAYRNGATALARSYMRVRDNYPNRFFIRGFTTMSDVDNGTGPFPSPSDVSDKEAGVRTDPWYAIADERTLVFGTQHNTGTWYCYYFGDAVSAYDGDQHFCVNGIKTVNASVDSAPFAYYYFNTNTPSWNEQYSYSVKADRTGAGPLLAVSAFPPFRKYSGSDWNLLANPSDGRFWLSPVHVLTWAGPGATFVYRGRLRFVYFPGHLSLSDGGMVTGAGELAGKTFLLRKVLFNSTPSYTFLALTADE